MKEYKPFLLVRLGSRDSMEKDPWLPTASQLRKLQEHLEDLIGHQYHILVYHSGIDVQVVGPECDVHMADVKSIDEFRKEVIQPVE